MSEDTGIRLRIEVDEQPPREVTLSELPASVGRRASCTLVLSDRSVAPLQGYVVRTGDGELEYRPEGGGRVTRLGPGARFQVGGFRLEVLSGPEDPSRPLLDALLDLVPRLWEAGDQAELLGAVVETLREAFSADWGAVLRLPGEGGDPQVLAERGRRTGGREGVSRTVLEQVLATGAAVLAADVDEDPLLVEARSIPVEVRSVVAAPLQVEGETRGLVYLESPAAQRPFGEEERALLGRVSAFAAEHLDRAERSRALEARSLRLEEVHRIELQREHDARSLVGTSPAMREVVEQIRQVTRTESTTLLLGESGTGKELVAREIHLASERRDQPFVAVNCMALPTDLVEDELFGHVKGAFSGAEGDRLGRFEMADGGTLFLDELGELSTAMQVKLLRALEERVVQRIGEGKDRPVDVRLVAATNADLQEAIAAGRFREDLFYRVSVFTIRLPPLRERPEDLPALAAHFVESFNQRFGRRVAGLTGEALDLLARHHWPGNVRELRNVIEAAFARETTERIRAASLGLLAAGSRQGTGGGASFPTDLPDELAVARAHFEKAHILRILTEEKGGAKRAAERLGMSRAGFYKKCGQLGIDPKKAREGS